MDSLPLQIKLLIEQIQFIENQVNTVEGEIESLMRKMNSPIPTTPGIGPVTGATILGKLVIFQGLLLLRALPMQVLMRVFHNLAITKPVPCE